MDYPTKTQRLSFAPVFHLPPDAILPGQYTPHSLRNNNNKEEAGEVAPVHVTQPEADDKADLGTWVCGFFCLLFFVFCFLFLFLSFF
jgi:hypothetical protein